MHQRRAISVLVIVALGGTALAAAWSFRERPVERLVDPGATANAGAASAPYAVSDDSVPGRRVARVDGGGAQAVGRARVADQTPAHEPGEELGEAAQADFEMGLLYSSLLREEMAAGGYDGRSASGVRADLLALLADTGLDRSRIDAVRCGGGLCEAQIVHPDQESVERFNAAVLSGQFPVTMNGGTSNWLDQDGFELRYSVFLARPGTQLPTLDQLTRTNY